MCSPWELAQKGAHWREWALIVESAENWAENEQNAHQFAASKNKK